MRPTIKISGSYYARDVSIRRDTRKWGDGWKQEIQPWDGWYGSGGQNHEFDPSFKLFRDGKKVGEVKLIDAEEFKVISHQVVGDGYDNLQVLISATCRKCGREVDLDTGRRCSCQ